MHTYYTSRMFWRYTACNIRSYRVRLSCRLYHQYERKKKLELSKLPHLSVYLLGFPMRLPSNHASYKTMTYY